MLRNAAAFKLTAVLVCVCAVTASLAYGVLSSRPRTWTATLPLSAATSELSCVVYPSQCYSSNAQALSFRVAFVGGQLEFLRSAAFARFVTRSDSSPEGLPSDLLMSENISVSQPAAASRRFVLKYTSTTETVATGVVTAYGTAYLRWWRNRDAEQVKSLLANSHHVNGPVGRQLSRLSRRLAGLSPGGVVPLTVPIRLNAPAGVSGRLAPLTKSAPGSTHILAKALGAGIASALVVLGIAMILGADGGRRGTSRADPRLGAI
jgi:hypothetical protein